MLHWEAGGTAKRDLSSSASLANNHLCDLGVRIWPQHPHLYHFYHQGCGNVTFTALLLGGQHSAGP